MSMRNLFGKWSGRRSSLARNTKKCRAGRGMCLRGERLEERTLLSLSTTPGLDYAVLANKDDLLRNVSRDLVAVYQEHDKFLAAGGQREDFLSVRADEFRFEADRIYVEVRGRGDFNSFFTSVESFGFEPWYSSESALVVEGYLPLGQLRGIAEAENTLSLFPVWAFGQTDVGSVDNQAQDTLYTDFASGLFDVDGTGVSIGVMSDSVNQVGNGLADSVATGDLPPGIQVLIAGSPGNIDEGRAMLELIHDIAPGGALLFASGGNTDAAMATAINTLVTAGADIIVDDLNGLRSEPFFQDGLASQAVTAAVNAGVAYFSSAGNRGESGFESPVNFVQAQLAGVTGNFHNFDLDGSTGVDVTQTVTLQPGRTDFVFQYDQPDGGVTSDLDIWVLDMNGNFVAAGQDDNLATQRPYETIVVNNPYPFPVQAQIAVRLFAGAAPTRFKWIGFNAPAVGEYDNEPGALVNPHNPGHSGNVNAMSTGAAAWFNPTVPRTFSSVGPVTRTLDVNGNPIPLQTINKPDITSHDGVNNTFFGQDIPEDPDIFPNFSGTSAAAPNAAAVAALLLDFDPTLTPAEVRTALTNSAIDIHDPGYDLKTGYGLIHSVDALLYLTGGVLPINGDRDSSGQNDTVLFDENSTDTSLIDVTLNSELLGSVKKTSLTRIEARVLGGDDTVSVDAAVAIPAHIFGGAGNDTLKGGAGNDWLEGGRGDDTYVFTGSANLGEDTIAESSVGGNDLGDTLDFSGLSRAVSIDLADDTQSQAVATDLALILEDGNAIEDVLGTALADVLIGNDRSNFLFGGAGNDSLKGGDGNDRLEGGAGNDWLEGGAGDDTYVFAGSGPLGHDTIAEFSQPSPDISRDKLDFTNLAYRVQVYLSNTDDQQVATNLRLILSDANAIETVFGTAYNDVIWGNDRDNVLYGNAGNDTISGGEGDDTVYGGLGDDRLYGYGGADSLFGEDDDDYLYGGYGEDYLDGGYGVDELYGGDGDDYLNVVDWEGGDTAYGEEGYDIAYGDYGDSMDAEYIYYSGGGGESAGGGAGPLVLGAVKMPAEDLIYGGLQDPRTLARWRETLWFYLDWKNNRSA